MENDIVAMNPADPAVVAKWSAAQRLIMSDVIQLPLAFAPSLLGWSKQVGGVNREIMGLVGIQAPRIDQLYIKAKA